jgi:pimeloyl-ACP methyl ester carboxylesterase
MILTLQLLAAPVLATCGDDTIDPGEQCDGTNDSACPGLCSTQCACPPVTTVNIASKAKPPNSPGSKKVKVTSPKLLAQFGPKKFSLNNARYTRFQLDTSKTKPDAILILIPGFEGGASNFRILAQNLLQRVNTDHGKRLEVWAFDRRTNQLEDTAGLELAEAALDPQLAEDWLFGGEIGLTLDPRLTRRAVFYNTQDDVPFMANWTNLVFSQDIDAVVTAAQKKALNKNVFLGGHSAGTGFTARYASTDFRINKKCKGKPKPGYAKLRGLVLLEGVGGNTSGASNLTDDSLDRMIAKFDGGLYGAVRDNAPRCVDGTAPCTIATEATDCAGKTPPKCTLPATAYAIVPGILNPRIIASSEPVAIQAIVDPDGEGITRTSGAIDNVPDLASLDLLPASTAAGGLGNFLDDDGAVAQLASFLAMSVGAPGPVVNGLLTWQDILHGPMPASVLPNNGAAPTALPPARWGQEKEVTRLDRVIWAFFAGGTNFADWYYPTAGPSTTNVTGVCTSGACTVGNVGAACSTDSQCSQMISLDSTKLSAPAPVGRGRCDIENLTQAGNINIPVIAFCGTNGSAPVPGVYTAFAQSIGTCTAPSCSGTTARVIDATSPNAAFPTFGDVAGGFEVHVSEGFSHLDVLTAEDNADNNVVGPLADFLARNIQ